MAKSIDLEDLNATELRALSDRLALKLARPGRSTPISENGQALWGAITDALGPGTMPMKLFLVKYGIAKYEEAARVFAAFLDKGCPGQTKVIRLSVARTSIACLISHLRRKGIPVTCGVICNSVGIVEHAVGIRFPGYAEAKLLHRVAPRAA